MNVAQDCLDKAHFFAERARTAEIQDRQHFRYYFETAIVWARSVTLLLQKQYNKTPGFTDWYRAQQNALKADKLAQFFLKQRNIVLKEQGVPLRRVMILKAAPIVAVATVSGKIRVIRGSSRNKLRYLYQDALSYVNGRLGQIKKRFKKHLSRRKRKKETTTAVTIEHTFFIKEPWDKEPAVDLLDKYLDRMQTLVDTTIQRFGEIA